ncbi:hypothetical protein [Phaeobacter sp. 11ANDIMAR09]|uniref:hypothetical protein n=1 Tax=Phaeobacter sp. 11ANDIMAR09 TaxID=1225647 RepID=UPI0006C8CF8A|nr:hypothetical protein [Phaeobacter sp. 11ANDIMAR09]KPD10649.1 hypothetical protein AN476_19720 [Phaeobacter sp. 11ANDIMAR09]
MADLTLLHTAQVHVDRFATLVPGAQLQQIVRPDWLARAQNGIDDTLRRDITETIGALQGPVLCSCTTIGEVAETAGATRIDWPMMQEAARIGGPILMTYCLNSTLEPSCALLRRAFHEIGHPPDLHPFDLAALWPLFEAGETAAFAKAISTALLTELSKRPDIAAVVLAQASMAGAAELLKDKTDVPILSSPQIALRTLLPKDLCPPAAKGT